MTTTMMMMMIEKTSTAMLVNIDDSSSTVTRIRSVTLRHRRNASQAAATSAIDR
jgi:hypothetical protein